MTGKTVSFLARHKYVVYLLFAVITVATLLLTLLPRGTFEGRSVFEYNKLGHFMIFFGWTFMLGFSIIIRSKKLAPLFLIFIAGVLFGIFIEFAQLLLPYGRTANVWDVVADATGSFAAVMLLWRIQTKYQAYLQPILSKNTMNQRKTLDS
ncbi:hypothetical protein BH23BAC3_BH23BAC3_25060 [soil metagenome]